MYYLTATKAAERLGVSEKTVRRWIKERKLTAHHPGGVKNRFAIPEDEVENLVRERAQYRDQDIELVTTRSQDMPDFITRVERLEQRLEMLVANRQVDSSFTIGRLQELEARLRYIETALEHGTWSR